MASPGDTIFGVRVAKESFNFSVAHFLIFDGQRREELHGHNYRVSVSIEGRLGPEGVVLDFLRLKPLVREVCQEIDHRTVFAERSPHLRITPQGDSVEIRFGADRFLLPAGDIVLLPLENTSTEHFARWVSDRLLAVLAERGLAEGLTRLRVEVSESPGQSAWCLREIGSDDA